MPESYAHWSVSLSGSNRSMTAPSARSSRTDSLTTCWRTSSGSRSEAIREPDLAQRHLGVGAARDVGAGRGELRHQVGVGDRDRCLRAEVGEHLEIGLVVRARLARYDGQRAERTGVAAERDGHDGPDAVSRDELGGPSSFTNRSSAR
jgi:hypothetical protein